MNIRIAAGMRDFFRWDNFYYKAIVIVSKCVRTGKRGGAFNLGGASLLIDNREFQLMSLAGVHEKMSLTFSPS